MFNVPAGSTTALLRELYPEPQLCECEHTEAQHSDVDYDFVEGRYVADPRACLVPGCDCKDFWF